MNENTGTIMTMTTEQMLSESKAREKECIEHIKHLEAREKEYIEKIKYLEVEVKRLNGIIEGLKFATRCNGISGGEVF